MLKETIVTGATIEEAIANGCAAFGVSEDDVSVEVLEYPQQKILGLFGGSPAKVRVYFEDDTPDEAQQEEEPVPEPVKAEEKAPAAETPVYQESSGAKKEAKEKPADEPADRTLVPMDEEELGEGHQAVIAANYLRSVVAAMGLDQVKVTIMSEEDKPGAVLNLTGSGLGAVIGRRGDTLTALQYLVSLAANNGDGEYYRIAINIGNYREKREYALEALAKKTAQRSLKIGRNLALEPMNPFERRIVHTAVQTVEGATSWSVDEGARRHVVIGPVGVNEGEDGLPVNSNRNPRHRQGGRQGGYNGGRGRGGYSRQGRGGYGGRQGGGYNKRYSGDRSRSYSSYSSNEEPRQNTAPKRDTTAPLYGRIEVPKRENNEQE